jgi:serine/threonine-protein kinase
LIGRELQNQYRITQKLGEGGFGAVYVAEEPRFARKVAIKTLHARLSHDPTLLERFRREGMAASRLEHPAAVKVFNLGQTDDGVVWMAMELLSGKTLAQIIEEKKLLSLEETCTFLKPIC